MRTIELHKEPIETVIQKGECKNGTRFELRTLSGVRLISVIEYDAEEIERQEIELRKKNGGALTPAEEAEAKLRKAQSALMQETDPNAVKWTKWNDIRSPLATPLPPEKDIERLAVARCLDLTGQIEESQDGTEKILLATGVFLPPKHLQTASFFTELGRVIRERRVLSKPWRTWVLENWLPLGMNAHKDGWGFVAKVMNERFPEQQKSENTWMKAFHAMGLHLDKSPGPAQKT